MVPHYTDYQWAKNHIIDDNRVRLINVFTTNPETVVDAIRSCRCIISSSLHGLIFAHAYGIPAVWAKFEDKLFGDNVKFYDYFASVNLQYPEEFDFSMKTIEEWMAFVDKSPLALPEMAIIEQRQRDLLDTFPFKIQAQIKR